MSGRLNETERAIVRMLARSYREPTSGNGSAYDEGWQDGAYSIAAAVVGNAAARRCEEIAARYARAEEARAEGVGQ